MNEPSKEPSKKDEEKTLLNAVVCFFMRHENGTDQVLLAIKAAKIGKGKRLPHGGGIEPGETAEQAAVREVFEETDGSVIVREATLEKIAVTDFDNLKSDGLEFICRVHIFVTWTWSGEFATTADMIDPQWFDITKLPTDDLMLADKTWLAPVLQSNVGGKHQKFFVTAGYGPRQETLRGPVTITPVSDLPE